MPVKFPNRPLNSNTPNPTPKTPLQRGICPTRFAPISESWNRPSARKSCASRIRSEELKMTADAEQRRNTRSKLEAGPDQSARWRLLFSARRHVSRAFQVEVLRLILVALLADQALPLVARRPDWPTARGCRDLSPMPRIPRRRCPPWSGSSTDRSAAPIASPRSRSTPC
jgi:hypothetical protein